VLSSTGSPRTSPTDFYAPMTHRERVHRALRREPTDRVPIFLWFHPATAQKLAAALALPLSQLSAALGDDVRQTWVGNNYAMEGITHEREGDTHIDNWGIEWIRSGPFNQVLRSPLGGATEDAVRRYAFPHDRIPFLLQNMEPLLKEPGVFVGCDVSPSLFEVICRIRGMEQAILDLAENLELAEELLEKAAVFGCALAEAACTRYRLDWLWTGDDVAGQQSLMMSPATWRKLLGPRLARIVHVGKRHGLPVAYHCCGAMRPIIPDLIAMGIDVLNPIQNNCAGMDARELKREFGKQLTFMGGLDTVDLVPRGTPREVLRETQKFIEAMTDDGGGYILAASHTVPPETPLENIFALYEAAGESKEKIFDRAATLRAAAPRA
jgi:uroporphyrinogen decarboxylase